MGIRQKFDRRRAKTDTNDFPRCRDRVGAVLVAVAGLIVSTAHAGDGETASGFDRVRAIAARLAEREFVEPKQEDLPPPLQDLSYDQFRDMRFRPDHSVFRAEGLPFEMQLFHRGYLYRPAIQVHVIDDQGESSLAYRPDWFEFGPSIEFKPSELPRDLGFAGLRVHCALNKPDYKDELIAFLGASYFRFLSRGQLYGISARGLAIDTATPQGEEFPYFREFFVDRPKAGSASFHLYAVLDSRSVTGAFAFDIAPGEPTIVGVQAEIRARREVSKLGVAPLTSMFLFGEDRMRLMADFRPEVHDSDGLLIQDGASSWAWRPLQNPERVHRVSRFDAANARGFGLMQRDRDFRSYQDIESRFERRPSYFVEFVSGFGDGFVELVEIPTDLEIHDNIVAYFVPRETMREGEVRTYAYRIHSLNPDPERSPLLRVESTRIHRRTAGEPSLIVLEFTQTGNAGAVESATPEVSGSRGTIQHVNLQRNPITGGLRLSFDWMGDEEGADLRARLRVGEETVSETWITTFRPQ